MSGSAIRTTVDQSGAGEFVGSYTVATVVCVRSLYFRQIHFAGWFQPSSTSLSASAQI
jgi:hypothetical protein